MFDPLPWKQSPSECLLYVLLELQPTLTKKRTRHPCSFCAQRPAGKLSNHLEAEIEVIPNGLSLFSGEARS